MRDSGRERDTSKTLSFWYCLCLPASVFALAPSPPIYQPTNRQPEMRDRGRETQARLALLTLYLLASVFALLYSLSPFSFSREGIEREGTREKQYSALLTLSPSASVLALAPTYQPADRQPEMRDSVRKRYKQYSALLTLSLPASVFALFSSLFSFSRGVDREREIERERSKTLPFCPCPCLPLSLPSSLLSLLKRGGDRKREKEKRETVLCPSDLVSVCLCLGPLPPHISPQTSTLEIYYFHKQVDSGRHYGAGPCAQRISSGLKRVAFASLPPDQGHPHHGFEMFDIDTVNAFMQFLRNELSSIADDGIEGTRGDTFGAKISPCAPLHHEHLFMLTKKKKKRFLFWGLLLFFWFLVFCF